VLYANSNSPVQYVFACCSSARYQCIRFIRRRNVVEFHEGAETGWTLKSS